MKAKELLLLLFLTLAALLIHGYHPRAEDAEIYLPGVEKLLHPELFPFNAQFFEPHAASTLFPNLIAGSIRLSHLPLEPALFIWHVSSIFLLLLACWQLNARCFTEPKARWGGVTVVAATLTLPVAGTALYIMDQYLNPRNLSAFAVIFAIVKVLDEKYLQASLFLIFASIIHPLMSAFALSFCILLLMTKNKRLQAFAALFPFGISLAPPPKSYHQIALTHSYHYLIRWEWYEWLGVIGPLFILWWFSRLARERGWQSVDLLCRTLFIYELLYVPLALALSIPARLEALARLQPMRSLYLLYLVMLVIAGGIIVEMVLKNHIWRWLALLVPLSVGMFASQRTLFPASAHIEWPGARQENRWVEAFQWIRSNTPNDAIFALDPNYMNIPGEDEQGFRAIAGRSKIADSVKDSGAVSMFPAMADEWSRQVQAQSGWSKFQLRDLRKLEGKYGIGWVVVQQPAPQGLACPYHNSAVLVCRLE